MSQDVSAPHVSEIHPRVYAAVVGLALWLVLSMWLFFGDTSDMAIVIAVVAGLILVAIGIPYLLWRTNIRQNGGRSSEQREWRNWLGCEFDTCAGCLKGSHAAAEILLPLAAVAFGMTAFGIVLAFTEPGRL